MTVLNYSHQLFSYVANIPRAKDRRKLLIDNMTKLEEVGKDCLSCSGMCCTYEHNSMLITPLEAVELLKSLYDSDRLDVTLIETLKNNVKEFRLDKEFNLGGKREFRRNYTCPFFNNGKLGCSIKRSAKPYGCLGFSPKKLNVSTAGNCEVYGDVHEKREINFGELEKKANDDIIEIMNLTWSKKNISMALLELIYQLEIKK